jgi:aspartate racemase
MEQKLLPGLLGMASPTSGVYLRTLHARQACGRRQLNQLRSILFEIDFAEYAQHIRAQRWTEAEGQIARGTAALKAAGADFLVITSNTGHTLTRLAPVQHRLPILDVITPTLLALRRAKCKRAVLLGTRQTLTSSVYQDAGAHYDLDIITPPKHIGERVHHLILDELMYGEASASGIETMLATAQWSSRQGADALILGCTDMTHLAEKLRENTHLFVADTAVIHACAAADIAWTGVAFGSLEPVYESAPFASTVPSRS